MLEVFCFLAGCLLGTGIMGILSHGAYSKGYNDALEQKGNGNYDL